MKRLVLVRLRLFQQPGGVIRDTWWSDHLGRLGSRSPAGSRRGGCLRQSRNAHRRRDRRRRVNRWRNELAWRCSLFKQRGKEHAQRTADEAKDRRGGRKELEGHADAKRCKA